MVIANGSSNGTAAHQRTLRPGVWAPSPAFFTDDEELDIPTFRQHIVSLGRVGMQPVVNGSMGEAFHLSPEERAVLVREARSALDEAGLNDVVIIAGTGGNSTRDTIANSKAAAAAGADIAIVIPPGYYQGAMSKTALKAFFADVAAASPIPVMIYNYPGAAGGIDMDSTLIIEMGQENPNICGVKLTCGAVGKLTRITAATATPAFNKYPRARPEVAPRFITLGGFADFLLPTVGAGRADGAIMGVANVYPAAIKSLFDLAQKVADDTATKADKAKALELQDLCAGADGAFMAPGIPGTKWWLKKHNGYPSARVRRPLLEFTDEQGAAVEAIPVVQQFYEVEKAAAAAAAQ